MKSPRLFLLLGFGTLLILIALLALGAFWRAERVYGELSAIQNSYWKRSSILNDIQADILDTALIMRDYIIDPQIAAGIQYRHDFLQIRSSMESRLSSLGAILGMSAALDRLRNEIDNYASSMEPIFEWTPQQKTRLGYEFLRKQVRPRRQGMIQLIQEINRLSADDVMRADQNMRQSQVAFRRFLAGSTSVSLTLALIVAGISFFHISRLERRSGQERRRIEQAEKELRLLSQKLVQAQEEERRSISRELHDEIGQMLTALRLELRNLEELYAAPEPDLLRRHAEIKDLAEKTLRAVRDLAMGLRPAMLDDLGLEPALQWQAREFSRHNSIPAIVEIDGDLDDLSEELRTCVYRVVQESLTNCARHAHAKNVRITVHGGRSEMALTIQDDGIGFDPGNAVSRGIGLIGMEERVRELGGAMTVLSQPNKGTIVEIAIPLVRKQVL
jgi:signal transduction histidine kinase